MPFDPAKVWKSTPRRIGYRKHVGHAVQGVVEGQPFESWVWFYFHEWRMVLPDAVLAAIGAAPGDTMKIAVRPHSQPESVPHYKPGPKRR